MSFNPREGREMHHIKITHSHCRIGFNPREGREMHRFSDYDY